MAGGRPSLGYGRADGSCAGCGCGTSRPEAHTADVHIKRDLLRGVDEIRMTDDRKTLHAQLGDIVESLRGERGSAAEFERAREVAVSGFALTRKGVRSQIDFSENDRGGRGGDAGCTTGRSIPEPRGRSDSNGRACVRDSDRGARRVLTGTFVWSWLVELVVAFAVVGHVHSARSHCARQAPQ